MERGRFLGDANGKYIVETKAKQVSAPSFCRMSEDEDRRAGEDEERVEERRKGPGDGGTAKEKREEAQVEQIAAVTSIFEHNSCASETALKSSVGIIRRAHLLWGYCGDNLSRTRTRKAHKDGRKREGGGDDEDRGSEGHVRQGRRNRLFFLGLPT